METLVAKALLAGIPFALIAGALGSVVQWRRMAFVGDSMAHSAVLGFGLSLAFGINLALGLALVLVAFALNLHASRGRQLPTDSVMAVGAHLFLASGILAIYLSGARINWESILFGDILSLTWAEAWTLVAVTAATGAAFALLWPRLVLMAFSDDIAHAETRHARAVNLAFLLMLCAYVVVGVHTVGVLLLNALLIIPVSAARPLAHSPLQLVAIAASIGAACVLAGLAVTFAWDIPMAPACVLLAIGAYACTWCYGRLAGGAS